MRFSPKARSYQALVAIVALFLIAGTAGAASFSGQGSVSFDSIKVGKSDNSSQIQLQGSILNPSKTPAGKGRPVLIADDLQVDKNATVRGNLILGRATWIQAPGAGSVVGIDDGLLVTGNTTLKGTLTAAATTLSSLQVTGSAGFANIAASGTFSAANGGFAGNAIIGGNATVLGSLDLRGALLAGPYNVGTTIVSNAGLTNRLSGMVSCVGTFAQFTVSVESDDYIFCFNTWMAGQPGSVAIASQEALSELQRAEVEKARTMLSADPVLSLPSGFAPLKH